MKNKIQIQIKLYSYIQDFKKMSQTRPLDPVKINQIFDKIFSANNLEIEERNLKNLTQKISLKLIDCGYLVSNHSMQMSRLFEWLGTRASALLQGASGGPPGLVCSMQAVQNFCQIFAEVSQRMEGRALIMQSGGKLLLNDLCNCLPQSEIQIYELIERIMKNLVENEDESGRTGIVGGANDLERETIVLADGVQALNGLQVSNQNQPTEDMRSEFTSGVASNTGFSRKDFSVATRAQPPPQQNQSLLQQSTFGRDDFSTIGPVQVGAAQHQTSMSMSHQIPHQSNIQAMMLQSGINQSHMEIMHKQQILKQQCELPFISLSDQDEKALFDLSVALKFGNPQTIFLSCQKLQNAYLHDFPVDVFLQRTDIIKALLDLLEGGPGAQQDPKSGNEWDQTELAQSCLMTFLSKLKNVYRFLSNNGCKPSQMEARSESPTSMDSYIEKTYPCNRLSRWEQPSPSGSGKRGQSYQSDTSGHNTLSCKALLGLILTKSIYLLQDTEKIGIFVQLMNRGLETLLHIYLVRGNNDFSELLHLCLFAFDKVSDFYREQLFDEVLVQPILNLILRFIDLLNSIPVVSPNLDQRQGNPTSLQEAQLSSSERSLAVRFKQPFTDTFFKNTPNLQRILRRCLFRYQYSEEKDASQYQIILQFFSRIESSEDITDNLMQKNVQKSFYRAQDCFAKFVRVTEFRMQNQSPQDEVCFVSTLPSFHQALQILQDLTECGIELKIDFPFEHLLLDAITYAGILDEANGNSRLGELEKLTQTFLAIPLPEIRERILRRLYQKLRVGNQVTVGGPKTLNNNMYLAKFVLRKGILNHFVNGILINKEIAEFEETLLQMSIGQLIVKIIILAFHELQTLNLEKNLTQSLNQFLLTFQCLLPQYSEIISLIELIESSGQKNCRYLRILRDLYSPQDHKREFATNVLRSSMSSDCQEEHIKDILKSSIDLRQPSDRVAANLELVNSNYDFSTFGIQDINNILQSSQQDYAIKKSSLEQLTMVLFDLQNKRGRFLFSQTEAAQDVFTFVLDEVLSAHTSSKNYLKGKVNNLQKDQILFVNECVRFMVYSYIFFNDEQVIQTFFSKVNKMTSAKKSTDTQEVSKFEMLLNALVYFLGSAIMRENCMLLLYIQVYQQLWICTKVQKLQAPNGQMVRNLTVLIPDFCQESIFQLIPYSIQAIRMPARDDLILSDEQKTYIEYRYNNNHKLNHEFQQLSQVGQSFMDSVLSMRAHDYRQVLKTGVSLWKNYLVSIEEMKDPLITHTILESMIEMLKVLPTRDHEYFDLADFLGGISQILETRQSMLHKTDSLANFEELLIRLMDGLKYHIMPYLEETGVSGINESAELCPKSYLLYRYLEFLNLLIQADVARGRSGKAIMREHMARSSFIQYLINLFYFFKGSNVFKKLILSLLWQILSCYAPNDFQIIQQICDMLVDQVSQVQMIYNQFEQTSIVLWCLRIMILLSQRRQLRISHRVDDDDGQGMTANLSDTYKSKLDKFKSFGWILRFTETRDARLRVLTWDLLTEIFDYEFLKSHPSVIHQSINTYLKNNELYCVKISVLKFLNKVCDALISNCEGGESNSDINDIYGSDQIEQLTVHTLLQTLNRQGLISQIHKILSGKDCPLLFVTLTLQLLHHLTQMDYKKAIPVLTQLDYWTFLVEMLDIQALIQIERQESREILKEMKADLNLPDPCAQLDMVYMTLNSILDFLFEAFKRDSQLAALLVKTTKLMQSVFFLVQHTLSSHRHDDKDSLLRLRNKGLLTVFIDKIVKVMHVAMLHPQDYSVDLISKFIFEQPLILDLNKRQPRNWIYFIEMFQIIENYNQTMDFTDIKLALIRFISEFLIQTAHFQNNFLDELVNMDVEVSLTQEGHGTEYLAEMDSYGALLFMEFAKVFKTLYIDQRGSPTESENQKKDISLCLQILLSSCQSAKRQAVDQNFLKKVIDICSENASALYLNELQKFSQKGSKKPSQNMFEQQFQKQYKYVNVDHDLNQCEREVSRMMQLIRNLFFDSENLLHSFVGSIEHFEVQSRVRTGRKETAAGKLTSQSDKLINMFGQLLEELGSQKCFEPILCEGLMTMITFASQNAKFKNCFIQPINVSTQSKKVTLLKLISEKITTQGNLQANSRVTRLLYTLMRSLSLSAEIAKDVMKMRFIEEVTQQITPLCKNDKDIKLCKYYLANFMCFLGAFTSTDEGTRQILKIKPAFELALFLLDTVNIPAVPESSIAQGEFNLSPLNELVCSILLFIRNATLESRQNKVHFLKNDDFLPCLLSFLSSHNQHPKIKAYTAAVLWALVHNHQGIKAAINKSSVISELQLMKSEYQRAADKDQYANYLGSQGTPEQEGVNYEYHANYSLVGNKTAHNKSLAKDMNMFILKALTGVLVLVEA